MDAGTDRSASPLPGGRGLPGLPDVVPVGIQMHRAARGRYRTARNEVARPLPANRLDPASIVGDMQREHLRFRMGRLDHVHIRVPDRAEAARWYEEHLGFEPVDAYNFWATGFDGGPLQIS